jgi:hypothetical protein
MIKPGSPAAFPVVPRRSQQPEAMVDELRDYLNLRYDGEATVAAKIGVASTSLSKWLVGKSNPSPESRVKIRAFFRKSSPQVCGD